MKAVLLAVIALPAIAAPGVSSFLDEDCQQAPVRSWRIKLVTAPGDHLAALRTALKSIPGLSVDEAKSTVPCDVDRARKISVDSDGVIAVMGQQLMLIDGSSGEVIASAPPGKPEAVITPLRREAALLSRAREARAMLVTRNFSGAREKALAVLAESPRAAETLDLTYQALGYACAYLNDIQCAKKYLRLVHKVCGTAGYR